MDIPLDKVYRLQSNVAKVTEVALMEMKKMRSLLDIISNIEKKIR